MGKAQEALQEAKNTVKKLQEAEIESQKTLKILELIEESVVNADEKFSEVNAQYVKAKKAFLIIEKSVTKAGEEFREAEEKRVKANKAYNKNIVYDYEYKLRNANRAVELAEIKAKEEMDLEAIAYKSNPEIKDGNIKKRLGQE